MGQGTRGGASGEMARWKEAGAGNANVAAGEPPGNPSIAPPPTHHPGRPLISPPAADRRPLGTRAPPAMATPQEPAKQQEQIVEEDEFEEFAAEGASAPGSLGSGGGRQRTRAARRTASGCRVCNAQ